MAGIVHIPWYATVLRGDKLAPVVAEIAPLAMRYGALDYEVRRSNDDRYKILQTATFGTHEEFYDYWEGPEFQTWRARHSSWFQVPILYEWYDRLTHGELVADADELSHAEVGSPAGDGR